MRGERRGDIAERVSARNTDRLVDGIDDRRPGAWGGGCSGLQRAIGLEVSRVEDTAWIEGGLQRGVHGDTLAQLFAQHRRFAATDAVMVGQRAPRGDGGGRGVAPGGVVARLGAVAISQPGGTAETLTPAPALLPHRPPPEPGRARADRPAAPKRTLQAGLITGLASFGALVYIPGLPAPLLWLLFFLAGCGLGSMVVCYALMRQANRPQVAGAGLGFTNGMSVGAGAVFQPLVGLLLDLNWEGEMLDGARVYSAGAYTFAFSVLVGYLVVCLVMTLFIRQHPRSEPAA